jgi:FkbM family methyltransferase
MATQLLQRLLAKLGYISAEGMLVPGAQKRLLQQVHQQLTMEVIASRHIDTVLDVGANRGQFALSLRKAGFDGNIVSFEPASAPLQQLERLAARDSKWTVINRALGASSEKSSLKLMKKSEFNSLLAADNSACAQVQGRNQTVATEAVQVARLDDLYPELKQKAGIRRALLKTDTQGYDLEVLRGAERTLQDVYAVQLEASFIPIYAGMPHALEALREVLSHDFELISLLPGPRHEQSKAMIEADCLFARKC